MRNRNDQTTQNEEQSNTYVLEENYTDSQTVAGISVKLEVSEVTIPRGFDGEKFLTTNPTVVEDELGFKDVALADEYTVKASNETVIAGGEQTTVRWLEGTMMEEVGVVRRVKEQLMSSGFDADMSLDEMARNSEDAVVQLYRGSDVKNAELMVKAISFNSVEQEIQGTEDIPDASEIRQWVDKTREKLEAAIEALEDIDSLARESIGNEYENPDATEQKNVSTGDELITDVEELQKKIYDSDHRTPESYADSMECELPDGRKLTVNSGRLVNQLKIVEDDTVETLSKSRSPAEILAEFNREVNERT